MVTLRNGLLSVPVIGGPLDGSVLTLPKGESESFWRRGPGDRWHSYLLVRTPALNGGIRWLWAGWMPRDATRS